MLKFWVKNTRLSELSYKIGRKLATSTNYLLTQPKSRYSRNGKSGFKYPRKDPKKSRMVNLASDSTSQFQTQFLNSVKIPKFSH